MPRPDAALTPAATAADVDPDATRVTPVPTTRGPSTFRTTDPRASTRVPGRAPSQTLPGGGDAGELGLREVGRYQVLERLGRGGMATVFKAHDPGIGRDVALKFLHASLCEDEGCRGRFLREARAAGGLSQPNIVTVHDVGEIEGRPYMAMEFIEGDVLSELMHPGQPLPMREVIVMGMQLSEALHYAHAHGIVHRDIKPGNIIRLRGSDTIKVTDFGIAHMDAGAAGEQRTRVGDVLGTPQYMSPEQTRGEKLDGRSDLFSVGIVLYQMLAGQRPFGGDSLVSIAMTIAGQEPTPLEKLRPDLPPALRRIVDRCLAKSPERRFRSGRELAEALGRVLAEMDEAARAQERPRIVPLRVKWAATMALVVLTVMALAATVITQRQYAAMLEQVSGYGASLARFIAAQNAVAALGEDWPLVDVAVQEMMKTGDFQSVTVIDRGNVVRAAGDPARVGQPYAGPAGEPLLTPDRNVSVSRYLVAGEPVLGFETAITFQGKPVGRVALGVQERPLVRVARLSLAMMAALVLVTVLAVAIAMYFLADRSAKPIRRVIAGMAEIARGHFDHRIADTRKDELGLLYDAFDRMAQTLQDAGGAAGVAAASARLPPDAQVPPPARPDAMLPT